MTEIEEAYKKLIFDGVTGQFCQEDSRTAGFRPGVSDHSFASSEVDTIVGLVSKALMDIQSPKLNLLISSCQTEPLDLSQKNIPVEIPPENLPLPKRMWKPKTFEFNHFFSMFIKRFTANDVCNARCQMLYKDHYHCFAENGHCTAVMKGKDQLRQHGKRHSIAEELTRSEFRFCVGCTSRESKSHYHCCHADCDFLSTHVSNMDRLSHVETTHCVIISKRTNGHSKETKNYSTGTKRRKKTQGRTQTIKELATADIWNQLSPLSSDSSDYQFVDFSSDPAFPCPNSNSSLPDLDHLSPGSQRRPGPDDVGSSLLLKINEYEKNFYQNGNCSRLFCNLKKGDHYHCPICDRGSSKKDLYVRHLKQRHK